MTLRPKRRILVPGNVLKPTEAIFGFVLGSETCAFIQWCSCSPPIGKRFAPLATVENHTQTIASITLKEFCVPLSGPEAQR